MCTRWFYFFNFLDVYKSTWKFTKKKCHPIQTMISRLNKFDRNNSCQNTQVSTNLCNSILLLSKKKLLKCGQSIRGVEIPFHKQKQTMILFWSWHLLVLATVALVIYLFYICLSSLLSDLSHYVHCYSYYVLQNKIKGLCLTHFSPQL